MAAPTPTSTTRVAATGRVPVRHDRLTGLGVLAASLAFVTLASQLHHHWAPTQSTGWRELPYYAVMGVIGWIVAFEIAYIAPHRAVPTERVSRRTAIGLAAFGVVCAAFLWFTPIPFCVGAAAILLARRAQTHGTRTRADVAVVVLGVATIVVPVVIAAVRIIGAAS